MWIIVVLPLLLASQALADDRTVTAEIWADNWFEMYVNGSKVVEDDVPITTERSFNAAVATFQMSTPAQIAIIAKDYKEDDTGLEYIGTRRQQMGDGGLIAQIMDAATGTLLAVTDGTARCLVVHRAPVDVSCADQANPAAGEGACGFEARDEPAGWMRADFDDSAWPSAREYSESEVRPRLGYDEIDWDGSAKLIWSESLIQDNTILCRLTVSE